MRLSEGGKEVGVNAIESKPLPLPIIEAFSLWAKLVWQPHSICILSQDASQFLKQTVY